MELEFALRRIESLIEATLVLLPGLVVGLVIFGLFVLIARAIRGALSRAASLRERSPGLAVVIGRVAGGLVIMLGLLVGLAVAFPSIGAADLFGLLGIGGVAIGFAFRDILQNLLAGILLLLTRPFRLGDQITAGTFEGTVEDIQIRATTIRTFDNRRAVIPNTDLFADKVLVATAYDRRRLTLRFGIGNADDIAAAKRVIVDAALRSEGVLPDPPPVARVVALADFAVQIDLFVWINPPLRIEALDVTDRVYEAAKGALTAAGIDLPFPTQQVLLHDQTEETDGDRAAQREGWPARGRNPRPRWRARRDAAEQGSEPGGAGGSGKGAGRPAGPGTRDPG